MKKRFISTLLVFCLMVALLPWTSWAVSATSTGEPTLTALTVQNSDGEAVSILDNASSALNLTLEGPYKFAATFSHTDQIQNVYITSIKDNEKKYLETSYNEQSGAFISNGYFDDDENFNPESIQVEYVPKRPDAYVTDSVDWDAIAFAGIGTEQLTVNSQTTTSINSTIDVTELIKDESKHFIDVGIETFDATTGSDLDSFLGAYKDLSQLFSYVVEGKDNDRYIVYLDLKDKETGALIVNDLTGNKYIKMILSSDEKLNSLSNNIAKVNTVSNIVYDYYSIQKDMDELRSEINVSVSDVNKRNDALTKVDNLENDKISFSLISTVLPLMATAFSVSSAPAILFSAFLGAIKSASDYFWDNRVGTIKSDSVELLPQTGAEIIASGSCGEHLTWTLNKKGTLTISGYGAMSDFSASNRTPWSSYAKQDIKQIIINSGATSIGSYAFSRCWELISVDIPNTVESIGRDAFADCFELKKITIPSSVSNIARFNVFGRCDNLKSAGPIGGNYNLQFGWRDEIPDDAFSECRSLTSIVIPNGITTIGAGAFFECSGLTNITIPNSVTSIGGGAFNGCSNLTSINIPGSVASIRMSVFKDCSNLTSAGPIGGGYNCEFGWTESIPVNAFNGSSLKSITIPDGVTSIGNYVFKGCNYLTSITIPDSVTKIGDEAFLGCEELTTAGPIGGGYDYEFGWTDEIPYRAFEGLSNLTSVTIPDGVTTIGLGAFFECSALTNVTIPSSVTSFGNSAFGDCSNLTSAGPTDGGYSYEFGWMEIIPAKAFMRCSGLINAIIPNGITSIEDSAFSDCSSLTSITIPDTVTNIGAAAFHGDETLTDVYYGGSKEQWSNISIGNYNDPLSSATIHFNSMDISNHTVTVSASGNGTVTGGGRYEDGEYATVTAIASSGENFLGWYMGNTMVSSDVEYRFLVNKDVTIIAKFTTNTTPNTHEHAWNTSIWSKDTNGHWHECGNDGCDIAENSLKSGYGVHVYDNDTDTTCDICGYMRAVVPPTVGFTITFNANGGIVTPVSAETKADKTLAFLPTPTRSGYTFNGWFTAASGGTQVMKDTVFTANTTIYAQWTSRGSSSGSGGGNGSIGGNTITTTEKNPDGSTTTKTENKTTGTVTETTKNPDGSQTKVETKKDGTVTTTQTDKVGNKSETVEKPDGTSVTKVTQKNGTTATVTTDAEGKVVAEVKLPEKAVTSAQEKDETIALPIPQVEVTKTAETASAVTIKTGSKDTVKVNIPTSDVTSGTVAVIVKADGTEEVVKTSLPTETGVTVALPDGVTVKIVDNSKKFVDVPSTSWASDAVYFSSARELFSGTSVDTFSPNAPMTRAMLVTVLARLDGEDTSGGATWYQKGMDWAVANGISDGTNPNSNITREQLAVMLWRYSGSPASSGKLDGFHDAGDISDYAQEAMRWVVENGIICGFSNGRLGPKNEATRAQVAQMLKNYLER